MSRAPQASGALEIARAARSSGYKSRLHMPELTEVKGWLDGELGKGGKTVNTLHREAVQKFPNAKVPAASTIKNYIEKYYEAPTVEIPAYAPDYVRVMSEFDSYLKLIELAKEIWSLYQEAKEQAPFNTAKARDQAMWIDKYARTIDSILEVEIKLKLRNAVAAATQPTLTQNNQFNQFNITGNGPIADLEAVEEIEDDTTRVDDWKSKLNKFRADRSHTSGAVPIEAQSTSQ